MTDVSLELHEGEVLALMGENGAGKSTLVKCLTGAHAPTSGRIVVDGTPYERITPAQARQLGIGAVYQEFTLVRDLPIVENMFMGNLIGNGVIVNKKKMVEEARKIFEDFGTDIDPNAMLFTLSPAMMQIVEIAKAVLLHTRVLILDEPTAPLTVKEVDILFNIIRKLKASGVAIIYISHRMEEVFEITDRIVVMRDGCYVCQMDTAGTTRKELVKAMIGRELNDTAYPHTCVASDEVVLRINDLSGNGVEHISFELHRGEILGVCRPGGGRAHRADERHLRRRPQERRSDRAPGQGGGCERAVPGDRARHRPDPGGPEEPGVAVGQVGAGQHLPVLHQAILQAGRHQQEGGAGSGPVLCGEPARQDPGLEQEAQFLSGGNQQKLIVAKWLATDSDILIFDEPTRGIDVGAKYEIYQLMHDLVAAGKSIIMVSSDFEELTGMSDRILVISEGRLAGERSADRFDKTDLLDLASGER